MAGNSIHLDPPSVYLKNCVEEVAQSVYGRDNRKPIHDAIRYLVNGAADLNTWTDELGLVVQGGKLCVVFDPTGGSDEPYKVPDDIKRALSGILTDAYGSEVRQDIVDAFTWGAESMIDGVSLERSLGLTVVDGKLCVILGEDPDDPTIPTEIRSALNRILTDVKGTDLRDDIVKVLRWGLNNDFTQTVEKMNDLGLVVMDGKLCVEYYDDEEE